jgi:hypothetical protein
MHNERQINSIHTGVVSPSLAQAVSTIVALKSNILADVRDELPGLAALDRLIIGIGFGVENNIIRLM